MNKKEVTPYQISTQTKKEQVTNMFNTIASKYDGMNRVISLGIDQHWRKKLVKMVNQTNPSSILDIATGTGDLAIALSKTPQAEIIGLDISPNMLSVGIEKIKKLSLENRIKMIVGDAENLTFENQSFDSITVAFGVRNFDNLDKGLKELLRVLKKGGSLFILETSVPEKTLFKLGYFIYSKYILATLGRLFSKDKSAYQYLSDSAAAFPYGKQLCNILKKNGFTLVEYFPQTMGVVTIYKAQK